MARTYKAVMVTATDEDKVICEGLPFTETCERAALVVAAYWDGRGDLRWSPPSPVVTFEADEKVRAYLIDNVVEVGDMHGRAAQALQEIERVKELSE
jgi:hypothetical protein